ncbi:hypothetical protein ANN_02611 [Periplaneta americana]|uniref:Uncharacterized protein n=1 Tax=Periplaneta americana TaxID=6978 RepID=A0ABQ8TWT8_PERAM|nr:hypothetical protein ANN_02611 [Periplaneta americana]
MLPVFLEEVPLALRARTWFQHDETLTHFKLVTRQQLTATFGDRWMGYQSPVSQPIRSQDLNSLDFFLWGHLKTLVSHFVVQPPFTEVWDSSHSEITLLSEVEELLFQNLFTGFKVAAPPLRLIRPETCLMVLKVADNVRLGQASPLSYAKGCSAARCADLAHRSYERIPNLIGEQSDGITVFRIPPMTSLMLHRCRTGAINLQRWWQSPSAAISESDWFLYRAGISRRITSCTVVSWRCVLLWFSCICFPLHNSNTNMPLHSIVIQMRKEAEIKPERIERLLSSLNQTTETSENRNCQSSENRIDEPREFNLPTLPQRRITYVQEKLPSKYGVHSEEYLPIRTVTPVVAGIRNIGSVSSQVNVEASDSLLVRLMCSMLMKVLRE